MRFRKNFRTSQRNYAAIKNISDSPGVLVSMLRKNSANERREQEYNVKILSSDLIK